MYLQSLDAPPEIIALQETNTVVKLPGYKTFQSATDLKTAVLVHRNIPAYRSQFDSVSIPHDLITVLPRKKGANRLYILNIYSTPKSRALRFNRCSRSQGGRWAPTRCS